MGTKHSPLIKFVLAAIDDLKGVDVRVIDVRNQTPMTDYMVICTGTSNRHVRSIAENVVREAKQRKSPPLGVEGLDSSEWVLVDLGDAILHVMQSQTRLFYQLEKLWDIEPAPVPKRKAAAAKKQVAKKATKRPATRKKATAKPAKKTKTAKKTTAKKAKKKKVARKVARKAAPKKASRKG